MPDDHAMDRLLREAMAGEVPQLSSQFDARVMRRVRPRRLQPLGRLVIAVYVVLATAVAAWLMRDLRPDSIVIALAVGTPLAIGASAYVRCVALGR